MTCDTLTSEMNDVHAMRMALEKQRRTLSLQNRQDQIRSVYVLHGCKSLARKGSTPRPGKEIPSHPYLGELRLPLRDGLLHLHGRKRLGPGYHHHEVLEHLAVLELILVGGYQLCQAADGLLGNLRQVNVDIDLVIDFASTREGINATSSRSLSHWLLTLP